jgi:sarcosine oxidase/L-pipecolate oxidase
VYADAAYENDAQLGARVEFLSTLEAVRSVFPPGVNVASSSSELHGYINRDGGWANAAQGISILSAKVKELGGTFVLSATVKRLVQKDGKTSAVETADGNVYPADVVVIATGSWTPSAFPQLDLGDKCLATGYAKGRLPLLC